MYKMLDLAPQLHGLYSWHTIKSFGLKEADYQKHFQVSKNETMNLNSNNEHGALTFR